MRQAACGRFGVSRANDANDTYAGWIAVARGSEDQEADKNGRLIGTKRPRIHHLSEQGGYAVGKCEFYISGTGDWGASRTSA